MLTPEIRQFRGLTLQRNSFNAPDGSLEVANNVVIESDNIIRKSRGFYEFYERDTNQITGDGDFVGITTYDDHLISVENPIGPGDPQATGKISYYDKGLDDISPVGTKVTLNNDDPVIIDLEEIEDARYGQGDSNLYITTDDGPVKLTSHDSLVVQAGAPPALDLLGWLYPYSAATWFGAPNQTPKTVAYRVVFGYEDANNNLILGAPSSIFSISNPIVLDAPATWTGPSNNKTATVTVTNHGLTTGMKLNVYNSTIITGAPPGPIPSVDGTYTITVTNDDQFQYTGVETPGGGADTGTVSYLFAMPIELEFSVPSEITTNIDWFYQIYRSSQQFEVTLSDYKLVKQEFLTPEEITNKVVTFIDNTDDQFLGAELYTNQNSGEGELQANFRPPKCRDIDLFDNFMIYANCRTREVLPFAVIDPVDLRGTFPPTATPQADEFWIQLDDDGTTFLRKYQYKEAGGNRIQFGAGSNDGVDLLITTSEPHGFRNVGIQTVYISDVISSAPPAVLLPGTYFVIYESDTEFKISATQGGGAVGYNNETDITFDGVTHTDDFVVTLSWSRTNNIVTVTSAAHGYEPGQEVNISASTGATPVPTGNYTILTVPDVNTFTFEDVAADDTGTLSTAQLFYTIYLNNSTAAGNTASLRIRDTAEHLVKAINRDFKGLVYAQYTSLPIEGPGKIVLRAKGYNGFISLASPGLTANNEPTGTAYVPQLPQDFTNPDDQVSSLSDNLQHGIFISKFSESESVPLVNFIPIGSAKAPIRRIHALRAALMVLKDDGVWRVTGDRPENFVVTLVDGTVEILASNSSDVLDNQVVFLGNQGVNMATENSVDLISRPIEDAIQNILDQPFLEENTAGFAYQIDRNYHITTTIPTSELDFQAATATSTGPSPFTITITTSEPHELLTGDPVLITNAAPQNGEYMEGRKLVTVTSPTEFTYQIELDPGVGPFTLDWSKPPILQNYIFNAITQAWTSTDTYFRYAAFGPDSVMYYVDQDFNIQRERRRNDRIDYSGQNHSVTVDAVRFDGLEADLTTTGYEIKAGDMVLKDEELSVIVDSVFVSGNTYNVLFNRNSNLVVTDVIELFEGYTSKMKFTPYSGGLVGRLKQFGQFQAHFRDRTCNALDIYFTNDFFDERTVLADPQNIKLWTSFFTDTGSTDLTLGTDAAPITRLYVPRKLQRGTFIQIVIESILAGDTISLQALDFAVKTYGERVSR
jgi:hypothetical protein